MIKLEIVHALEQFLAVKWIRFESDKSQVMRSDPAHQLFYVPTSNQKIFNDLL